MDSNSTLPKKNTETNGSVAQNDLDLKFTKQPTRNVCPFCNATIFTHIKYETDMKAGCCETILCCFVWCFMPRLCPYNNPYRACSCKKINHYCPDCNKFLGTYEVPRSFIYEDLAELLQN